MKKLFKKVVAGFMAAAIAVTSMVTGVSAAEFAVSGATDNKVEVNVAASVELTVTTDEATITAKSDKESVATATVDAKKVTIKGVSAGSANVTISDGKATPVKIAVTVKRVPAVATTVKLYTDTACTDGKEAPEAGVSVYVNGKDIKGTETVPAAYYKTNVLYFKENAAVTKIIATTTTGSEPKLTNKGALPSDDAGIKEAKNMASVKADLRNKKVTISAGKKTSDTKTVTAWVFGLNKYNEVVTKASTKVVVKGAATSISFYSDSAKKNLIKTGSVDSKASATFYFAGAIKAPSKDATNTLASDLTYKVEKDSKIGAALTVTALENGTGFTVTAGELTEERGKVKTKTATITVTCVQSGAKASLKVVIGNDVTKVKKSEIKDGYATLIDEKGDVSKVDINLDLGDDKISTTDKISVLVLTGDAAFNAKLKQTTAKSKAYSAKLQKTDATNYRIRVTTGSPKATDPKTATIYIVTTNVAKVTKYYKVATVTDGFVISAVSGEISGVIPTAPVASESSGS